MLRRIWLITRAELEYHRALLIACFSLFVALALVIGLSNHRATAVSIYVGPPFINWITFMFWIVIIGHSFITFRMITTQRVEQHLRLLLPLPVNRVDVAKSRISTVLLLHVITTLFLILWVYIVMDVQDFRFTSRYRYSLDAWWIRWQLVGSVLTVITISACISFLILLLESRVNRPLLSTVVWVLFLILPIGILILVGGRPPTFISHGLARIAVSGFRRGGGISLVSLLIAFVLMALILACIYQIRIRRQTAYRSV